MMKKFYLLLLTAGLTVPTMAQEKFELGKPNDDNYRYLDGYKALKEYIDYSKYPNFKLGAGTTVNTYVSNSTYKSMIDNNFTETVAGNAMKMASCVDGNGNMNFTNVKKYVEAAAKGGINVYGHTLAWHSQQPKAWLLKLLADKKVEGGEEVWVTAANKDFRSDKTVGWKATESEWGYSISFSSTDGLVVKTTQSYPWQVQFVPMSNSGKLVRVSELDMGYVRGSDRWGKSSKTEDLTEAEHKKMADFYEWIFKEYFRIIPPEQQWGICQWCTTDAPANSGWRGGEPTGIEDIEDDKAIDISKGIYNIQGVSMSATSLDELPCGIYIVNGKKVVVK